MVDENILYGPTPIIPISLESLGLEFYNLYKNNPDDVVFSDPIKNLVIKGKDVYRNSCIVALKLQQLHLTEHDVIGLSCHNCPEFFYILFASLYIGIPITLFNPRYTQYEMQNCLNVSKPKIVFCSEPASTILKGTGTIDKIITIDSIKPEDDNDSFENFLKLNVTESELQLFRPVSVDVSERVALILYSSGTTGLPKGVCLTHENINAVLACSRDPRYFQRFQGKTAMGVMPFFHSGGLCITLINLIFRKEVVILKSFDPELYLKVLQDKKVEIIEGVPTIAKFLVKSPLVSKYKLHAVGYGSGGALLGSEIIEKLIKRLQLREVWQSFGMTEMALYVTLCRAGNNKLGSSGQLVPYVSSKVVDIKTGQTLSPLQTGELCFKGPHVMKGYMNNEAATKLAIDEDGWLHSGDIGYYDHEGHLFVVDRLKELIKYKEFQVSPTELENILLSHSKILDAGVVGIPHEDVGELPVAFVVKIPTESLTEAEVQEYVAAKVSSPKHLRGGVIFVKEIPKTPSNKIMRPKLKSMLKSKM